MSTVTIQGRMVRHGGDKKDESSKYFKCINIWYPLNIGDGHVELILRQNLVLITMNLKVECTKKLRSIADIHNHLAS